MKIFDCPYDKEFVFNLYSRICPNFKDYEKITKKKMLEKILDFYSDYNNIIDICTYREIIFLKMIVDGYAGGENSVILSQSSTWSQVTEIYAVIIIAIIPMLIAYPFIQKYFKSGITLGANKG